MNRQLAIDVAYADVSCKARGCRRPVVGSSTSGTGHVCKGHNEREWGRRLRRYNPPLAAALLADAEASLEGRP